MAVVGFFLGGAIIYHLRSASGVPPALVFWLLGLIVLAGVQTTVSAVFLQRLKQFARYIHAQIAWDLLFVLAVILLHRWRRKPLLFPVLLIIVAASVFLPRGQLLFVASAAAILYGSLLDLQYYGYLPLFGRQPFPQGCENMMSSTPYSSTSALFS